MSIKHTKKWFEVAIPEPTVETACIQVGCHYEEVSEMTESTLDDDARHELVHIASAYKMNNPDYAESIEFLLCKDNESERKQFLDDMCDQIVTAIGVCHMFGFDIEGALAEVNRSNFSKFEDGKAVFDENGKIKKGANYTAPNLAPFLNIKE